MHDLEAKVDKAMSLHGARYLHVLVPCPLGWGSAPSDTIRLARLAQRSGLFPLFEAEHGEVTSVLPIRGRVSWRSERAVNLDELPPCNHACPAGEQIQGWLHTAEGGSYETGWRRLVSDVPFPAVIGRICHHPCETACHRAELNSAVGINSVERCLGDEAVKQGWQLPPAAAHTGRRLLIVGAGPSGLSAAHHLRRPGHEVEIHEAGSQPGGMMRFGIPTFRLRRDVLDSEIDRLLATGVTLKLASPLRDLAETMRAGQFDAAFLAVRAQLRHRAYIPAGQAARVLDALSLLGSVNDGERPQLGRTVLVYGDGNTAMDVARTARRLGDGKAVVVYRRTQAQMPANAVEFQEALDEGVSVRWLRTITAVGDGVTTLERMRRGRRGHQGAVGTRKDQRP